MWDPAKNLALLIKVHAPFPILIAGDDGGAAPAMPAGTSMLGLLPEVDLLALFRESAIYLCTSRYEPFGLAPLEAALCGCAVLANDLPSLREVWGDAALYFQDAWSLSGLLSQLGRDPEQLAAAQRRSRLRAQTFSAACMADQYLALYRRELEEDVA
jgi:glycosyltransferase involved in cell wall biosynthesis